MRARFLLRDLALVCFALCLGWWVRGINAPVHATSSSTGTSKDDRAGDLSFQLGGTSVKDSLTLYSPANHTLYIYPAAVGNSYINCAYSLRIEAPGKPIQRENCAPGAAFPH